MKVAVFGANGRMGKELVAAANAAGYEVCASTRANKQFDLMLASDVIIDFSTPQASSELLKDLLKHQESGAKCPALLVGTTGLLPEYFLATKELKSPYFWASNTSIGIAVLTELSRQASKLLKDFDIEITEAHHKFKKDAPSGTALSIAKEISAQINAPINSAREGERKDGEIGISAIRGGDIAGRHIVGFYGDGEWIELQHYAQNRSIFAKGAIKIAAWLIAQPSGQYGMKDFIATVL